MGESDIAQTAAAITEYVVMSLGVAVIAALGAIMIQTHNQVVPGQQVEIAIDCGQADARQALAHPLEQVISGGVTTHVPQFFEYYLSLPGVTPAGFGKP